MGYIDKFLLLLLAASVVQGFVILNALTHVNWLALVR